MDVKIFSEVVAKYVYAKIVTVERYI